MDNSISPVSFGKTYYSKLLLTRFKLSHEFPECNKMLLESIKNCNSSIHDKQPPEFLKKLVGQSKFF